MGKVRQVKDEGSNEDTVSLQNIVDGLELPYSVWSMDAEEFSCIPDFTIPVKNVGVKRTLVSISA